MKGCVRYVCNCNEEEEEKEEEMYTCMILDFPNIIPYKLADRLKVSFL